MKRCNFSTNIINNLVEFTILGYLSIWNIHLGKFGGKDKTEMTKKENCEGYLQISDVSVSPTHYINNYSRENCT